VNPTTSRPARPAPAALTRDEVRGAKPSWAAAGARVLAPDGSVRKPRARLAQTARRVGVILVLLGVGHQALCDGCGLNSLAALAHVTGQPLSPSQRQTLASSYGTGDLSMLELRQAAADVGIELRGVAGPLAEVLRSSRRPKVLHLRSPDHFLVVVRQADGWAQVLEGGGVAVMPYEALEQRYSGHALLMAPPEVGPQPRVELDSFAYDFGEADLGTEIQHTFILTNGGDAPLLIRPPSRGACNAPKVELDRDTPRPGEQAAATVTLTITYTGEFMESAKLLTTDPAQPVIYLTVHGNVPHVLEVVPATVDMSGPRGATISRPVLVTGPADMRLFYATGTCSAIDVDVGQSEVDDYGRRRWGLQVALDPTAIVGQVREGLLIRTSSHRWPLVVIPITGVVRGDLRAVPTPLFFGFLGISENAQRTLVVESRTNAPFTIRSVAATSPVLSLGQPTGGPTSWAVPVSVDTSQPAAVQAMILISTDVPGEETLEIPVYAHVLAQE